MDVQRTATSLNRFNMQSATTRSSGTTGAGFDQQLSVALAESLSKLGVTPGEVNISIRNGATASARQIVITWDEGATATPATGTSSTGTTSTGTSTTGTSSTGTSSTGASATGSAGNPFAMSLPAPSSSLPGTTQLNAAGNSADGTPWSPWYGSRDRRDEIPVGGGQVTASGAPMIVVNETAVKNQHNYTGLGAFNPYFTTPSNPLREGYVVGFNNWFRQTQIVGSKNGPVPANSLYFTTEEGAQEALRLVQQYVPDAELTEQGWGGGIFSATNNMHFVKLPGDRLLNAGMLLGGYYNHGYGVTPSSDALLASAIQQA